MKTRLFASRSFKEIIRDPLSFFFGLGFPLILLALLSFVNANLPPEANNPMFEIEHLAPGLGMFGTVFMALFAGTLLTKDRSTSFLMRLFTSPLHPAHFLAGYALPLLAVTAGQALIVLLASSLFGLPITVHFLPAVVVITLTGILFISIGLLVGALLNEKAVGGVCGAGLTNLAGWLSGVFMPLHIIGGAFRTVAEILPFYHSVQAIKLTLAGNYMDMLPHLGIVLAYTIPVFILAVLAFRKKMAGDDL